MLRLGCVVISPSLNWYNPDADSVSSKKMIEVMKEYSDKGLTLYVGSDSMLYSNHCVFSCIIAIHSNNLNIANYYFQKQKIFDDKYKTLENKIIKEIQFSIEAANFLRKNIENSKIEVHVDIGDKKRNATRHLVDTARGWIKGMGYDIKIKPNSWASSVADWHTK